MENVSICCDLAEDLITDEITVTKRNKQKSFAEFVEEVIEDIPGSVIDKKKASLYSGDSNDPLNVLDNLGFLTVGKKQKDLLTSEPSEVEVTFYTEESRLGDLVKLFSSCHKFKNGQLVYSSTQQVTPELSTALSKLNRWWETCHSRCITDNKEAILTKHEEEEKCHVTKEKPTRKKLADIFNELEKKAIVERYKNAARKKSKQISPSIEVRNKYECYFKNKQHCDDRHLKSRRKEFTEKRLREKYENVHDSSKGTDKNDNACKHFSEKIMHRTSGHYKSSVKSPKKFYGSAEERSHSQQRKMSPSQKHTSVTPETPALQKYVSFFFPRSPHKSLQTQPVKSSRHSQAQAILPGSKQVSPGHLRQYRQFGPHKKHDYRSQYTDKASRICRNELSEEGQVGEPYGHRHFSRGDVIPDRRPTIKDRTRSIQSISTQPFVPKVSQEERQPVIDDDADQTSPSTSKTSICTIFFDEEDSASSKNKEVRQIEDNQKDKEQEENGIFDTMHQQHIAQTSEIRESEKHAARSSGKQPTQLKDFKARKHVYPHKIVHLTDTGKRLSQHFKEGKTDLDSKRVFQLDHLTPSGTDPFADMPPEGSSLQSSPKYHKWSDDPSKTVNTKEHCTTNEYLKYKESSPLRVVEKFVNREALENYRNKYGNILSKENSVAVKSLAQEDFRKEIKKCQVGQLIESRPLASDIQPHSQL